MNHWISTIAPQILDLLSPIIVAAIAWVCVRAAGYIRSHTKNLQVQGILLRLNDAVGTAVGALEQTMVLAAKLAASDGQLTGEDGRNIKAAALAEIKSHLGPEGISALKAILGVQADTLDSFLGTRVEAAVLSLPIKVKVAPSGVLKAVPSSEEITQPLNPTKGPTP